MFHQYFSNQYLVNQILRHASVDDNSDCEISHFSRFRKRFYDQVFELLDGCSGGVVVDSFQLHNTVKHCGLSSRRSRVQIPAGALHNRSIISIDLHIISKYPPFPRHLPPSSTYSIISRREFSLIISNLTSNGWAEAVVCRSELSIIVSISIHVQTLSTSCSRSILMKKVGVHDSTSTNPYGPHEAFRKWYDELLLLWVISRVFLQNIYRLPKYQFGSESNQLLI